MPPQIPAVILVLHVDLRHHSQSMVRVQAMLIVVLLEDLQLRNRSMVPEEAHGMVIQPRTRPPTSDLFSPTSESESMTPNQMDKAQAPHFVMPRTTTRKLPHGVQDLATWGKTLLVLPKFAEKKWSYRKLLEVGWNNRDVLSYIRWIRNTYYQDAEKPTPGKASDLAAFLIAVDYPAMERMGYVGAARTLVED